MKQKKILFICIGILLLMKVQSSSFAKDLHDETNTTKAKEWLKQQGIYGFTENKGQIIDQDNKPNPQVKYLLNLPTKG